MGTMEKRIELEIKNKTCEREAKEHKSRTLQETKKTRHQAECVVVMKSVSERRGCINCRIRVVVARGENVGME